MEDEAGEACWRKLAATPGLQERLFRVELKGVKDVSKLHKQDPENFRVALRKAREEARAWLDIAESAEEEHSRQAWASCQELAESADILAEFAADLERCRLVGETKNAKLLYLALTSRLLEKIVSVAVKGPSSGGKSYLVKQVMSFFPKSAYCRSRQDEPRAPLAAGQDPGEGGPLRGAPLPPALQGDARARGAADETPGRCRSFGAARRGRDGWLDGKSR